LVVEEFEFLARKFFLFLLQEAMGRKHREA